MNLGVPYILSQIFTIITYALLALTYYAKDRKKVLTLSFLSLIANGVAYIFLSAWTGLAMCIVALIRNIIFLIDEKKSGKRDKITPKDVAILSILYVISIISAIYTYDGFLSLLSVFATMLYTFSVWQKKTNIYKLLGIPIGILWISYNIYVESVFGVILETVLLICSITGYILEIKNKNMNNLTSFEKRESVKKDYDAIADFYAKDFGKEYEDLEVISEFMSKLKPKAKILDLGGGTGKLTDLFIKNNNNAICYDFSKEMMRKSREYFGELPYILDDMLNVKKHFDNESFDGVIAFYSLFHIPKEDLNNLFSDINDILKSNGILCFAIQLGNGEEFTDEPYLKEEGKNSLYMNFCSKEFIDEMLANNNFEKIYETTKNKVGENELGSENNKKLFIIARKKNNLLE